AGPFAIEHTSVDTIQDQRLRSDWFLKVVRGLEVEFLNKLPYQLDIIFHFGSINKGQNWQSIRNALNSWIANDSPLLSDGKHKINEIEGIPFEFRVIKASDRRPGLLFARIDPGDKTLAARLRQQLSKKTEKLAFYKKDGKTTILLIESDDIALMNRHIMLEALQTAVTNRLVEHVDRIWYADTSIPSEILFYDFTLLLRKGRE
ncbi:MAG: hypothetical protein P8Y66_07820, partial [Nitrospirota bacterium]